MGKLVTSKKSTSKKNAHSQSSSSEGGESGTTPPPPFGAGGNGTLSTNVATPAEMEALKEDLDDIDRYVMWMQC